MARGMGRARHCRSVRSPSSTTPSSQLSVGLAVLPLGPLAERHPAVGPSPDADGVGLGQVGVLGRSGGRRGGRDGPTAQGRRPRLAGLLLGPGVGHLPRGQPRPARQQHGHQHGGHRLAAPPAPGPLLELAAGGRLGLLPGRPLGPPAEDRRGEHVVEDLVARLLVQTGRARQGPDDAGVRRRQRGQHGPHPLLGEPGVVGQVDRAVADLAAGRGDQVVEDGRGHLLLLGRQPVQRLVQVRADDPLGAAEGLKGRDPQPPRPLLGLPRPQAGQHHLEVGGLDRRVGQVAGRPGGPAPPDHRQHHPADPDPLQHPADQLRLGRPRLLVSEQLVVPPERLQDRGLGLADAQMPDAHVVLEQVGDAALEAVQPGQRVLADGDQEAHRQVGPVDRRRELGGEAARPVLVPVVEEVLLELVQDQQQLQVPAGRPGGEGPGQPPGRLRLGRAGLPEHPRDLLRRPGPAAGRPRRRTTR